MLLISLFTDLNGKKWLNLYSPVISLNKIGKDNLYKAIKKINDTVVGYGFKIFGDGEEEGIYLHCGYTINSISITDLAYYIAEIVTSSYLANVDIESLI